MGGAMGVRGLILGGAASSPAQLNGPAYDFDLVRVTETTAPRHIRVWESLS